jgi:hypothetical protein
MPKIYIKMGQATRQDIQKNLTHEPKTWDELNPHNIDDADERIKDKLEKYYVTEGKKLENGLWQIKYKGKDVNIYTGEINNDLNYFIRDNDSSTENEFYIGFVRLITILSVSDTPPPTCVTVNELSDLLKTAIVIRHIERLEYERVIGYTISSSKILLNPDPDASPYSDLLYPCPDYVRFNFDTFSNSFPGFGEFLEKSREINLMISGSSALYSLDSIKLDGKPADIDIYVHKNQNQTTVLKKLDEMIRSIYNKPFIYEYSTYRNCNGAKKKISVDSVKIVLVRSPYILSWIVLADEVSDVDETIQKSKEQKSRMNSDSESEGESVKENMSGCVIVSYQVILSPCADWSHVFAGYHSDIVCTGYLTKQQQFVVTPRFMDYYNGNTYNTIKTYFPKFSYKSRNNGSHREEKRLAYFVKDLVSPRYRDRVDAACLKYQKRGLTSICICPFDDIIMTDVARSSPSWDETWTSILKGSNTTTIKTDICPSLVSISKKEGVMCVSESLVDVYQGETFRTIIEIMACFQSCPGCGVLVFNAKNSLYCDSYDDSKDKSKYEKGCFCDECFKKEMDKMKELKDVLGSIDKTKTRALITGGRCGIGQTILRLLKENGVMAIGTTRFPDKDKRDGLVKLDLKDFTTYENVKHMLESGGINILVLSASETLHYPSDDSRSKDWDKSKSETSESPLTLDWTNDFKRDNSGVWHKCLSEHTQDEIISPLMANVAGNAILLGSFLNGVKKMRAIGNRDHYCCIVVTSFEGSFSNKTPFHPVTNACKSALEQIVYTVKAQADFLDAHVLLADPGWVYTEGSFGKFKGPVPIDFGASQILQPLVHSIKGTAVNAQLFRRMPIQKNGHLNALPDIRVMESTEKKFKIELYPCGHIVDQCDDPVTQCSVCRTWVETRKLVTDTSNHKKYALQTIAGLPTAMNGIILDYE